MSANKRGSALDTYDNIGLFSQKRMNQNPGLQRQSMIERNIQRVLTELAVNRFSWRNLPETMDPRFIEMCLLFNGLVVVYWDTDYERLLGVRGAGQGYVNMMDNPVSFTTLGPGVAVNVGQTSSAPTQFRQKTIRAFDPASGFTPEGTLTDPETARKLSIPIWPNYVRYPDIDTINIYASRLATIDRTIEINTNNARRTKVVKGTQQTQLSVANFNRSLEQGDNYIMVTGPMQDLDSVEVLDLGVNPEAYEKLHILRTRLWNECMGLLGIDNANQDKKERLVAAEVSANDAQATSMYYVNLQARRYAADLINKVHGTNIEVDFNTEVYEKEQMMFQADLAEQMGGDNGDVHDGTERSS